MKRGIIATFTLFAMFSLGPAQATIFNFDITFDGVSANIDPSSDPVAGTVLVPGSDGFSLDIHAAGNDFWEVNNSVFLSIYAGFFVLDGGVRTGNITTTFLLDGTQVAQDVDLNLGQASVHMGAQVFNLAAGTLFDQVVVDYTFLASTSTYTTIQSSSDVIGFQPFFRDRNIAYVKGVPEPATLALLGLGLVGLGFNRRRKV